MIITINISTFTDEAYQFPKIPFYIREEKRIQTDSSFTKSFIEKFLQIWTSCMLTTSIICLRSYDDMNVDQMSQVWKGFQL